MSAGGSIVLACDAPADVTRLRALRCEGLARASRAFALAGGGIRVQLSTLGPGILAGDRFALDGTLGERAVLSATGQMATPVFAGTAPSRSEAAWSIGPGAFLAVHAEPLLLEAGAEHETRARYAVDAGGAALIADVFAVASGARLRVRTHALIGGALAYRDALEVRGEERGAFGTVAFVCAGARRRTAFAAHAERLLEGLGAGVRAGLGETAQAIVVRLHGARVWDVRAAAHELVSARTTAGRRPGNPDLDWAAGADSVPADDVPAADRP